MQKKDVFGLHHIGIYVLNVDDSIKFYEEVLGFHLDYKFEVEANNGFLKIAVVRQSNQFCVELLQEVDTATTKKGAEGTYNHFAMYVDNIAAVIERLKKEPRVVCEMDAPGVVEKFGNERVQYFFIHGINGERIELIQADNL